MPLNRTPPASPIPSTTNETPGKIVIANLETVNALQQKNEIIELSNVTERKKKRTTSKASDKIIDTLPMNIFANFTKEQEKRFDDLIDKINNIITQNVELKESVQFMSSKHDELLTRISNLETERREDKKRIQTLQDSLDNLERKSKACGIELRNVPKKTSETKVNLRDMVVNLGNTLDLNINSSNIKDVFRAPSKNNTGTIIVELDSVISRNNLLRSIKDFNKNKERTKKLNTTHIGLPQPAQPIYLSESLTHRTQKLYAAARAFRRNNGFQFCWTMNNYVYLRKTTGDNPIRINTESDLDKLSKSPM